MAGNKKKRNPEDTPRKPHRLRDTAAQGNSGETLTCDCNVMICSCQSTKFFHAGKAPVNWTCSECGGGNHAPLGRSESE